MIDFAKLWREPELIGEATKWAGSPLSLIGAMSKALDEAQTENRAVKDTDNHPFSRHYWRFKYLNLQGVNHGLHKGIARLHRKIKELEQPNNTDPHQEHFAGFLREKLEACAMVAETALGVTHEERVKEVGNGAERAVTLLASRYTGVKNTLSTIAKKQAELERENQRQREVIEEMEKQAQHLTNLVNKLSPGQPQAPTDTH